MTSHAGVSFYAHAAAETTTVRFKIATAQTVPPEYNGLCATNCFDDYGEYVDFTSEWQTDATMPRMRAVPTRQKPELAHHDLARGCPSVFGGRDPGELSSRTADELVAELAARGIRTG